LTIAIIGILVLAWVAFLAPTILRSRNNQSRSDSVGDFHHRLRALGGTNGQRKQHGPRTQPAIFGPMSTGTAGMSPAQRRRRDVLLVLAGIVVVTFLAAVFTRSMPIIAIQLLADAALAGYVYLLIQYKQRAQPTRGVRPLPGTPTAGNFAPYPTYALPDIDLRGVTRAQPRLVPLRQTASN
jgi:hypothetical protein